MPTFLRPVMRLAFRLLYNELAFSYDWVSAVVSIGQWRSWQRTGLSRLRGKRILEIAHGTGDLLMDLVALGFAPIGMDLSRAMGGITRRKLARHALSIPLLRARVQALPFADHAFPSLLSTFPAEFIVEPPAVTEFYRVLQPGGVLVVVPIAQIAGSAVLDRLAEWLFRVTGQAATNWFAPVLGRYEQAGFTAHIERVLLPRSIVTLIVAEKPVGWKA